MTSQDQMPEPRPALRNPFRSEADAFRLLVIVVVAAAPVIALAALVSSAAGAALGAVLIAVGLRAAYRWTRVAIGEREDADTEPTGPGA